jgi:hypothetical protein
MSSKVSTLCAVHVLRSAMSTTCSRSPHCSSWMQEMRAQVAVAWGALENRSGALVLLIVDHLNPKRGMFLFATSHQSDGDGNGDESGFHLPSRVHAIWNTEHQE